MSRDDKRKSEAERRLRAQQAKGKVRHGSGERIEGRRLDQMVSVRLEPELVSALRDLAEATGQTMSDLLREAAAAWVAASARRTFMLTLNRVSTGEASTSGGSQRTVTAAALMEVPGVGSRAGASSTAGSDPSGDVASSWDLTLAAAR
jgi:predicted DNA-binding protein